MPETSKLLEYVRGGRTLDYLPIVDFHSHICSATPWYYVPDSAPEQVVAYMDRIGIDHAVSFSLLVNSDVETGNEYQYGLASRWPRHISALSELHAAFPGDWLPTTGN